MAKSKKKKTTKSKKKNNKKKKLEEKSESKSPFWRMAWAILLIVGALFLFLGGFGAGGRLPVGMFDAAYWMFGWAAYLTPVALAAFGLWKFSSEDKRVPIEKLGGMFALLILLAGWLQVVFDGNETGGMTGSLVATMSFSILDQVPAAILLFVLMALMLFLVTGWSLEKLNINNILSKLRKQDALEGAELAQVSNGPSFQVKANVPIEQQGGKRSSSSVLKNTGEKLTQSENHAALTAVSDPDWEFPPLDMLESKQDKTDAGNVEENAQIIKSTFENFNINVEMEEANVGPRVTQYTFKPAAGTRLNKITGLENNLALDLAASSIRIEAPIPGKKAVGVEVPNKKGATVRIRQLLQSKQWGEVKGPLGIIIGKDIGGDPLVGDLGKMPHLLVAGQTGSGKSVMINNILTSLLYRNSPSDLKLILVDPKRVELKPYDDIPHLLTPVITEPEKCISALKWTVAEMERRYKALAEDKRRNITEYNNHKKEEGMPHIVVVIDELADMMMMAARDVESLIVRIAQKARAVGIHLVLATQRPSVDVITGLIKANVPARIAFTTASQVDSRTIIDQNGSEKLLGQGDMLFKTADMPKPKRVQAAFISDEETNKVTDFIRMQRPPQYDDEVVSQPVEISNGKAINPDAGANVDDDMYRKAVDAVIEGGKASTSYLQMRLRIGYGRAARLMQVLEDQGIISAADGNKPRKVLVTSPDQVFGGVAEPSESDQVLDENFPD